VTERTLLFAASTSLLFAASACGGSARPVTTAAAPVASSSAVAPLDCTSTETDHDRVAIHADLDSMTGTVSIDGLDQGTRRLLAKVTPYSATYIFLFAGYGPGDQKPTGENLVVGTSIVARLVSVGDDTVPYFDGDVPLHDAAGKKLESLRKCDALAKR
jgi:hypothetical protein